MTETSIDESTTEDLGGGILIDQDYVFDAVVNDELAKLQVKGSASTFYQTDALKMIMNIVSYDIGNMLSLLYIFLTKL